MTKTHRKPLLLLAMLLATSATGLVFAAAPASQSPAPQRLDANNDGVVDRQEAAARPRLAQRFDELDKNKDGKLSREEMAQMRHDWRHGGDRHGGHRGQRDGGFMRGMDTDNDGRISAAEYQAKATRTASTASTRVSVPAVTALASCNVDVVGAGGGYDCAMRAASTPASAASQ